MFALTFLTDTEGIPVTEHIIKYYQSVCEAFKLSNVESSYNTPIIALLTQFGCAARDMSGERGG